MERGVTPSTKGEDPFRFLSETFGGLKYHLAGAFSGRPYLTGALPTRHLLTPCTRFSMLGVEVSAEESHTIRASDNKDNTNAGLSSGEFDCTVARKSVYHHEFLKLCTPSSGACCLSFPITSSLVSDFEQNVVKMGWN